jgi:hypothetical protein
MSETAAVRRASQPLINEATPLCSSLCLLQPHYPEHSLTDWIAEAEAAMEANVQSVVVDRPGNAPLSEESRAKYPVIQQLTDLP